MLSHISLELTFICSMTLTVTPQGCKHPPSATLINHGRPENHVKRTDRCLYPCRRACIKKGTAHTFQEPCGDPPPKHRHGYRDQIRKDGYAKPEILLQGHYARIRDLSRPLTLGQLRLSVPCSSPSKSKSLIRYESFICTRESR